MPINNTQGSFNTGRDVVITVMGPNLVPIFLANVTEFESKPVYADIKIDRLDGVQLNAALPKGWTGSITADRGSNAMDALVDYIEANWYANGTYQVGQIFEQISETDGSTTVYAYDNVAFKMSDAGMWKGDSSVKQKLDWEANRRRLV